MSWTRTTAFDPPRNRPPGGGGPGGRSAPVSVYQEYTNIYLGGSLGRRLRIEALEIDDAILDKIESEHGVSLQEAEEACLSEGRHVRQGREGLYKVFSQIESGRYLLVVLAYLYDGVWRIVTARDLTDKERKLCQEHRGESR